MAKMKIQKMSGILEEAILLEEGIGELYKLFRRYFTEDD